DEVVGVVKQAAGQVVAGGALAQADDRGGERRAGGRAATGCGESGGPGRVRRASGPAVRAGSRRARRATRPWWRCRLSRARRGRPAAMPTAGARCRCSGCRPLPPFGKDHCQGILASFWHGFICDSLITVDADPGEAGLALTGAAVWPGEGGRGWITRWRWTSRPCARPATRP